MLRRLFSSKRNHHVRNHARTNHKREHQVRRAQTTKVEQDIRKLKRKIEEERAQRAREERAREERAREERAEEERAEEERAQEERAEEIRKQALMERVRQFRAAKRAAQQRVRAIKWKYTRDKTTLIQQLEKKVPHGNKAPEWNRYIDLICKESEGGKNVNLHLLFRKWQVSTNKVSTNVWSFFALLENTIEWLVRYQVTLYMRPIEGSSVLPQLDKNLINFDLCAELYLRDPEKNEPRGPFYINLDKDVDIYVGTGKTYQFIELDKEPWCGFEFVDFPLVRR